MLKERIPETEDGLQGEFIATVYNDMQRHIRDRGWLAEKINLLLGCQICTGHVLEIGPGPGYFGLEWLKATTKANSQLTGLDISSEMISMAQGNASEYGLESRCEYILGDCHHMPFPDGIFDAIITHSSLHEWVDPIAVLLEVHRVLKPGGQYCIIDLRRDLSKEAISFMRNNINMEMRKGFANSVRASYTSAELRQLLVDTPLAGAKVQDIELGLYLSGEKTSKISVSI